MPQLTLMISMTLNTILFLQMNHPMTMGFILLIQTILNCLITGFMTKSFWFSYILFLIFVGGMLILFIYMASLASNEKLKFNPLIIIKINSLIFILLITYILFDKFYMINYFNTTEMMIFSDQTFLVNENHLSLSKMYDSPNNFIIILMINYLLLTLIIIVKITNLFQGPLRPKIL